MIRRASFTSINSFQKSQLKQVNVRRSNSFASSATLPSRGSIKETYSAPVSPVSPTESMLRRQSWWTNPTSPISIRMTGALKDGPSAPDTPISLTIPEIPYEQRESSSSADVSVNRQIERTPEYLPSPEESTYLQLLGTFLDDSPPAARQLSKVPRPVLNNTMPKRRPVPNQQLTPIDLVSSSPPSLLSTDQESSSPSKVKSPTTPRIPLQQQISAIISEIHAPIRLASTPTPPTPITAPDPPSRTASTSKYRRLPSLRTTLTHSAPPTRSSSPLPALTLAPASREDARRAGVPADAEIQLYHLHSGSGGAPIKLFVRRVGADGAPRVMVRVGGGWADLREYLRAYAEHHGRAASRAASDAVRVAGLRDAEPAPRKVSAPGPLGRPDAVLIAEAVPPEFAGPHVERSARIGASAWSESGSSPVGRASSPFSAPGSAARRRESSGWARADQRSLAGPVAAAAQRKGEMSEEKRDWVEGIVEQAKMLHFGGSGGKEKTKRVFLKGKE